MLDLFAGNIKVKITEAGALDEWGQVTTGKAVTALCSMRELTILESDSLTKGNKELLLEAVLRFTGDTFIKAGYFVELEGSVYPIVKVKKLRDLAGECLAVLAYI